MKGFAERAANAIGAAGDDHDLATHLHGGTCDFESGIRPARD
jgi:hypothetical protein